MKATDEGFRGVAPRERRGELLEAATGPVGEAVAEVEDEEDQEEEEDDEDDL